MSNRRQKRLIKIELALIVTVLLLTTGKGMVFAAAPDGLGIDRSFPSQMKGDELFAGNPIILRIQKVLAAEGRYKGRLDGQMNVELEAAIRIYQKRNRLKADGKATETLAKRMETHDKVQALLNKLERARLADLEKARLALLSNPLTKHLAQKPDGERANPTRDTTACFSSPTPACLLTEASESAKAVSKKDRRDWALGEILVAQTKAGLVPQAMETVERISDLRLVIVALRNIAVAQANIGRQQEALDAVSVIPDSNERLEALVKITEVELERYKKGESSIEEINVAAKSVLDSSGPRSDLDGISAISRIVAVLAATKQPLETTKALKFLENKVESFYPLEKRADAYRHLSAAYAATGNSDQALKALKRHSHDADPTSVLVATAKAHLRNGKPKKALNMANGITADRYLSILLARVAVAQFSQGKFLEAQGTLALAKETSLDISLPFAKAYALSKVALSWSELGNPDEALRVTSEITDERIKAQTLWAILSSTKGEQEKKQLEKAAWEASNEVSSTFARSWIFADAATSRASDGKEEKAREAFMTGLAIADTITNPWGRARILAKLAGVLVDLK